MGRLVVAVSHSILGECIMLLLKRDTDMQVVSRAREGTAALQAVQALEPDLLIMNVHMAGVDGIEATRRIRLFNSTMPILLLGTSNDDHALAALMSGPTAFLDVGRDLDRLLPAARALVANPQHPLHSDSRGRDSSLFDLASS